MKALKRVHGSVSALHCRTSRCTPSTPSNLRSQCFRGRARSPATSGCSFRRVARVGLRQHGRNAVLARAEAVDDRVDGPARRRQRSGSHRSSCGDSSRCAIGGVCFGVIADYIGRTKALAVTILIYSLFTGLSAVSQSWQQLAAFSLHTGLGLGGEWAAGAAMVAEVWPDRLRAKAGAMLQSAVRSGTSLRL